MPTLVLLWSQSWCFSLQNVLTSCLTPLHLWTQKDIIYPNPEALHSYKINEAYSLSIRKIALSNITYGLDIILKGIWRCKSPSSYKAWKKY